MYREHSVGVVVPAYNESGRVGGVLRTVPSFVDRIYAVDDRSTDDTWAEIRDAADDVDGSERARTQVLEARPPTGASETGSVGHDGNGTAEQAREVAAVSTRDGGQTAAGRSVLERVEPATSASHVFSGATPGGRWSAALAARASEVRPGSRVVPIRHDENRGAGGAIKTGYLAALADGVDVVVTVDGDGQMDPGRIPRFLDPIVAGDADYTKGDRFADTGSLAEMPPFRLVGNTVLTLLTRIASGYWSVSDPQNGYTAVSTDALRDVGVVDLFEYYGYCNELLVRLNVAGATVEDVPMPATYGEEESHIDFGTYVPKVSAMLFRNFLWRLTVTYLDPDDEPEGARIGRYRPEPPVEPDGGGGQRRVGEAAVGNPNGSIDEDRTDSTVEGRGDSAVEGRSGSTVDGRSDPTVERGPGSTTGGDSAGGTLRRTRRRTARVIEGILGR